MTMVYNVAVMKLRWRPNGIPSALDASGLSAAAGGGGSRVGESAGRGDLGAGTRSHRGRLTMGDGCCHESRIRSHAPCIGIRLIAHRPSLTGSIGRAPDLQLHCSTRTLSLSLSLSHRAHPIAHRIPPSRVEPRPQTIIDPPSHLPVKTAVRRCLRL